MIQYLIHLQKCVVQLEKGDTKAALRSIHEWFKVQKGISQMENQGTLNSDSQIFSNQSVEKQPTVVSTIITQLSLTVGIKQWVKKSIESIKSYMRKDIISG